MVQPPFTKHSVINSVVCRNDDWMKGVTLLRVGHFLIMFKMYHKTFLRMRMIIGCLEPLVVMYIAVSRTCHSRSQSNIPSWFMWSRTTSKSSSVKAGALIETEKIAYEYWNNRNWSMSKNKTIFQKSKRSLLSSLTDFYCFNIHGLISLCEKRDLPGNSKWVGKNTHACNLSRKNRMCKPLQL